MGRHLETAGVKDLLDANLEHPEWDDVALRCLSCGNCTMVCPTCFCCTVTDSTYLDEAHVTRTRYWESCFTHQFTHTRPARNAIRPGPLSPLVASQNWGPGGISSTPALHRLWALHHLVSGGNRPDRGDRPSSRRGPSARQPQCRTGNEGGAFYEQELLLSRPEPICGMDTWMPAPARILKSIRRTSTHERSPCSSRTRNSATSTVSCPAVHMVYVPGVGRRRFP